MAFSGADDVLAISMPGTENWNFTHRASWLNALGLGEDWMDSLARNLCTDNSAGPPHPRVPYWNDEAMILFNRRDTSAAALCDVPIFPGYDNHTFTPCNTPSSSPGSPYVWSTCSPHEIQPLSAHHEIHDSLTLTHHAQHSRRQIPNTPFTDPFADHSTTQYVSRHHHRQLASPHPLPPVVRMRRCEETGYSFPDFTDASTPSIPALHGCYDEHSTAQVLQSLPQRTMSPRSARVSPVVHASLEISPVISDGATACPGTPTAVYISPHSPPPKTPARRKKTVTPPKPKRTTNCVKFLEPHTSETVKQRLENGETLARSGVMSASPRKRKRKAHEEGTATPLRKIKKSKLNGEVEVDEAMFAAALPQAGVSLYEQRGDRDGAYPQLQLPEQTFDKMLQSFVFQHGLQFDGTGLQEGLNVKSFDSDSFQ